MKNNKKRSFAPVIICALLIVLAALGFIVGRHIKRIYSAGMYPLAYQEELKEAADRYGLDRYFLAAVVCTESRFRAEAVSSDGAEGLMQVLPSTAEWIAGMRGMKYEEGSLFDPATNLDYGCWLMRYLLDRYGGSEHNALIAYNAGAGRLDGWLDGGADENGELIEIPYAETRAYVEKITKLKEVYLAEYEEELGS
jgi:soluble lytic murein transglycosylase